MFSNRDVRPVLKAKGDWASAFESIKSIAAKLGIGSAEPLRQWMRRANDMPLASASFFGAELDRQHRL